MIKMLLRKLKLKRNNLKLMVLLLSFSSEVLHKKKKTHQLKLKKHQLKKQDLKVKDGIKELPMMLPENKLLRKLHPKLKMKQLKLPKTKRLLIKLPQMLLLLQTLTQEIEKVLSPTLGMSTGSPRLFHNQRETLIVPIEN